MRQAVVVIHGVGEQKPMATLRSFLDGVLPGKKSKYPKYYSKPDRFSSLLELRLLRTLKKGKRPATDFFEFYWAHHMRDSTVNHVKFWAFKLLFRWPSKDLGKLLGVYWLIWLSIVAAALLYLYGWHASGATSFQEYKFWDHLPNWLGAGSMTVTAITSISSYFLVGYVADAARYLTPTPGNISQRNKIRQEGLALLKSLHDSGKYNRIIVVGHSLGSVIGYDLLRILWDTYREPSVLAPQPMPGLDKFESQWRAIYAEEASHNSKVERFQQLQHRLWRELRHPNYKMRWLITDFITLGSPLTHAKLLMSDKVMSLDERKGQNEYPECPPRTDHDKLSYRKSYPFEVDGSSKLVPMQTAHHSAPFACTRWANLYFPHRWLIWGDMIAGPLKDVFGSGIKDIAVRISYRKVGYSAQPSIWSRLFGLISGSLVSHVCYWRIVPYRRVREQVARAMPGAKERKLSVKALVSEMRLQSLRSKHPWPEP